MPKDILLNGASPMKFHIAVVFARKQKKKLDFKTKDIRHNTNNKKKFDY
jgi:hypothetical protein